MGERGSIRRNFLFNLILTASAVIFPLITFPYATRVLGPEALGEVSFAVSFVSYFSLLAQLGIPTYGQKICAQQRDDKALLTQTVHELFLINMIACVLCYSLLFVCVAFIPRISESRILVCIVSANIVLNSVGMNWLFAGLERFDFITSKTLVFRIASIIFLFMVVRSESDYLYYAVYTVLSASASNVINIAYIHKLVDVRRRTRLHLKKHLKPVFTFFAFSLTAAIYINLDTVMLGFLSNSQELGYYYAATKMKSLMQGVVGSLGAVVMPRAAYYAGVGDDNALFELTKKGLQFTGILSIGMAAYAAIFANDIVAVFAGPDFMPAVPAVQLAVVAVIFLGFSSIIGMQVFIPFGKERWVVICTGIGAIVDAVLNLQLIPQFGAIGAAASTTLTELLVLVIELVMLRKYPQVSLKCVSFARILGATVIAGVLSVAISSIVSGSLAVVAVSLPAYAMLGLLFLVIFREPFVVSNGSQIALELRSRFNR